MTIASSLRSAALAPSKGGVTAVLLAGIGLATPSVASAASTFATWDVSAITGSLNGVNFTVSGVSEAARKTGDFNTGNHNFSGSQNYLDFLQNDSPTITITFDSAVSGLEMYLYYFRGGDPLSGGFDSYTFSESFSITAGLAGIPVSGSTLDTSSAIFASGILSFTGPVTSLTITTTGSAVGGYAGFTMAQDAGAPAVPGIGGVAALAAIGCGRRRRR
jgi:hypothetical protein